ncbi:MAG: alpha/beta hydrolase [Pseudomonadota bacterium]|nr:MAG: alpha/beta hydrolase [Pseudomonadota bacterium]
MRETVVFLHGIWMTGIEMAVLRRRVQGCGYDCHQFCYHSVLRTPAQNAARLDAYLATLQADVVHLVAHSLGGIVLLHLFDEFPMQKPGRVLMLGSPISGSSLARQLDRYAITRPLLGRAGERGLLGDAPRWKGTRELGVIAGNRGIGIGMLVLGNIKPPHDGTVAVTETHTSDVTVHLQVPYSHFGMLFRPAVAHAVCAFLQTGDFAFEPGDGSKG